MAIAVVCEVVDPVTNITYVAPVVGFSYIDLAATVILDGTGRYKFVPDAVVMADGTRYTLAKALADTALVPDRLQFLFSKPVTGDTVVVTDVFAKAVEYVRKSADAATISDAQVFSIAKALFDQAVVADATALQFSRPLSDVVTPADLAAKAFSRPVVDSFTLADSARRTVFKPAADVATTADDTTFDVAKFLFESVALPDAVAKQLQKLVTDGVAMNDAFDAGDGAIFSFSKGVSNVTMVSDATSTQLGKARADEATVSDAGVLNVQDYCDITYFLEDYVGVSRVF